MKHRDRNIFRICRIWRLLVVQTSVTCTVETQLERIYFLTPIYLSGVFASNWNSIERSRRTRKEIGKRVQRNARKPANSASE